MIRDLDTYGTNIDLVLSLVEDPMVRELNNEMARAQRIIVIDMNPSVHNNVIVGLGGVSDPTKETDRRVTIG